MFSQDFVLKNVKVSGEISNCKYHQTGAIYFTLKDDDAALSCAIFKYDAARLKVRLENGQKAEIEGRIAIYEKTGSYSLYGKNAVIGGAGDLYRRFEELKAELEDRGLFADEYKRPIPKYVRKLGVVTAPRGAAVRDIIDVAKRRNPGIQIIVYPALVQGEGAASSIADGIRAFGKTDCDVIIVGRGGGSIEDLWAFNEEEVAQAIFDSSIPVISAVGHETDFTIADFVADRRAPTPSAAAEIAVYDAAHVGSEFRATKEALIDAMESCIREARRRSENLELKLKNLSPENQMLQKKAMLMSLEDKLDSAMNSLITDRRHKLSMYIARMKGLSPLDKLNQGYSVASGPDKKRISSVNDVAVGDELNIYVSDGYLGVKVMNKTDLK